MKKSLIILLVSLSFGVFAPVYAADIMVGGMAGLLPACTFF